MKRLAELWSTVKRLLAPGLLARGLGRRRPSRWVTKEGLVRVPVPSLPVPKHPLPRRFLMVGLARTALLCAAAPGATTIFAVEPASAPTNLAAMLPTAFSKINPENLDDLRQMQDHIEKLSAKLAPSTVHLSIGSAQGSGVIIHKDGYVLTAGHVSGRPGRRVTLTLHDGRQVEGTTLGRNQTLDSGMIKINDAGDWTVADLGSSESVKSGEWCLCLGHPGGFQKDRPAVIRLGRVLRADPTVVRTDCLLVGGDSGGPLFDMHGRVIGIHSRIAAQTTANFHVPIVTYLQTWERLAASEDWTDTVDGPVMGVRGQDDEKGCMIVEAFPGKPASKAGIKVGDVITRLDGKEINGLGGLVAAISKHKVGDKITVEYLRGEESHTAELTLVAR